MSQVIEGKLVSKGHSLPVKHKGRDRSGDRLKVSKQKSLTLYQAWREEQVRTWKEHNIH
jgi:hypothetical protein